MMYKKLGPRSELKSVVDNVWVAQFPESNEQDTYIVIANTCAELTFGYVRESDGFRLVFSFLLGQTTQPKTFTVPKYDFLIGITIFSFALHKLFGLSPSELCDQMFDIEQLATIDGSRLLKEISHCEDESFLLLRIQEDLVAALEEGPIENAIIEPIISEINEAGGMEKISDISTKYGISNKKLVSIFKSSTGLKPKSYSRICRFNAYLNEVQATSSPDLIANDYYYDQAHMVKEFKAITGLTPTKFWALSE